MRMSDIILRTAVHVERGCSETGLVLSKKVVLSKVISELLVDNSLDDIRYKRQVRYESVATNVIRL